MHKALARCDREIARCEAELRAGGLDMEGILQGLQDWTWERRCILSEIEEQHEKAEELEALCQPVRCAA